jgi:hypothetical protein
MAAEKNDTPFAFPFQQACPADLVIPMQSLGKKLRVTPTEVYLPLLNITSFLLDNRVKVGRTSVLTSNTRLLFVGRKSVEYESALRLLVLPFYQISAYATGFIFHFSNHSW